MNPINALGATARFLNQPVIKEGLKNVFSSLTFAGGLFEIYQCYQHRNWNWKILKIKLIKIKINDWRPTVSVATKTCSSISIILSAGVSRPGVYLTSSLVGAIFSKAQLERQLGPNTIYAINPTHPRHVFSIAAVIFAMPSLLQSTCRGAAWAYKKMTSLEIKRNIPKTVTEREVEFRRNIIILFNTITSRPVLHKINQLF